MSEFGRSEYCHPFNLSDLNHILHARRSYAAFMRFLVSEFSVENVIFWTKVNKYRSEVELIEKFGHVHTTPCSVETCTATPCSALSEQERRAMLTASLPARVQRAQAILQEFILSGSPHEINVPSSVSKPIKATMLEWQQRLDTLGATNSSKSPSPTDSGSPVELKAYTTSSHWMKGGASANLSSSAAAATVAAGDATSSACADKPADGEEEPSLATIFDVAQSVIFKLMQTDSFLRFQKSQYFQHMKAECEAVLAKAEEKEEIFWTPDEAVNNCMSCSSTFTLVNRKHHCRLCGQVICKNCSPHFKIIDQTGKPVRVCVKCEIDHDRAQNDKTLVIYKGYLSKMNHRLRWKKRYFVLMADRLVYFKQKDDKRLRGTFMLRLVRSVDPPSSMLELDREHCFVLSQPAPQVPVILCASDGKERATWITHIHDAILNHQQQQSPVKPEAEGARNTAPL